MEININYYIDGSDFYFPKEKKKPPPPVWRLNEITRKTKLTSIYSLFSFLFLIERFYA